MSIRTGIEHPSVARREFHHVVRATVDIDRAVSIAEVVGHIDVRRGGCKRGEFGGSAIEGIDAIGLGEVSGRIVVVGADQRCTDERGHAEGAAIRSRLGDDHPARLVNDMIGMTGRKFMLNQTAAVLLVAVVGNKVRLVASSGVATEIVIRVCPFLVVCGMVSAMQNNLIGAFVRSLGHQEELLAISRSCHVGRCLLVKPLLCTIVEVYGVCRQHQTRGVPCLVFDNDSVRVTTSEPPQVVTALLLIIGW